MVHSSSRKRGGKDNITDKRETSTGENESTRLRERSVRDKNIDAQSALHEARPGTLSAVTLLL